MSDNTDNKELPYGKKRVLSTQIEHPRILFFLLLALYFVALFYTTSSVRSDKVLTIMGSEMHLSAFPGVFSTLANMCLIVMAVYLKKPGFITGLSLLILQFPILIINFIQLKSTLSLSGTCNDILTIIVIVIVYQRNKKIEAYRDIEVDYLKARQKGAERLFEQTATALVNAIDAKDEYSRGHSLRVAEYSRKIAEVLGKSEDECREIYYAGLLHDVGKIGVADSILTKNGKLDAEEYEAIKQHTEKGKQILMGISEYPYLSIGANSHHERYDGKGYPEKLKGDDIPEIARIISVADAYDAMSSNRSYRDGLPQQLVREEIVKGSGTQFDPKIARVMQHLIDRDTEYQMKEREEVKELSGRNEINCGEYRDEISEGILITRNFTKIKLKSLPEEGSNNKKYLPSLILFDSLDGRVHDEERTIRSMNYYEYAEVRCDGEVVSKGVRKVETNIINHASVTTSILKKIVDEDGYKIDAVRYQDHALVSIDDGMNTIQITVALPDSTRYLYIALTGERCHIKEVSVSKVEGPIGEDYIPRIAPKISYINEPVGDIPNVQVDGFRSAVSKGIPISDGLKISFHTKSLPTARLIWHCPYIMIYHLIDGNEMEEYALVRLDGENWESYEDDIKNDLFVNRQMSFVGWDEWKEMNKQGYNCVINFERKDNKITLSTENLGILIKNTTYVDDKKKVYVALTGDQVALTDIRISQ